MPYLVAINVTYLGDDGVPEFHITSSASTPISVVARPQDLRRGIGPPGALQLLDHPPPAARAATWWSFSRRPICRSISFVWPSPPALRVGWSGDMLRAPVRMVLILCKF
jgi:hypothetical protein